ncbi:NAD(P)-binding protein [Hypoxylon sp. FL1284]|nr:NAD(P)-binding protein [Hypoxylon sp. FL1284]
MDITGNALVFGAGGGIGRSTCLALATAGARGILIADVNLDAAKAVAKETEAVATNPHFRVEAAHVDITLKKSVDSVLHHMVQSFGRIDYCVICAGIICKILREIADADIDEFMRIQQINVTGTFLALRAVTHVMRSQEPLENFPGKANRGITRGSIVTLGSIASCSVEKLSMQYTTSKHAVLGMTKAAALDSAKHGIRVNCVCPGFVDTGMIRHLIIDDDTAATSASPMGRLSQPEEVADAITFLCSPRSSFITGGPFMVDGGCTISFRDGE